MPSRVFTLLGLLCIPVFVHGQAAQINPSTSQPIATNGPILISPSNPTITSNPETSSGLQVVPLIDGNQGPNLNPSGNPRTQSIQLPRIAQEPPARYSLFGLEMDKREKPLGPHWGKDEFLLWWIKPGNLPPLALRSRSTRIPTLNDPNSTILIGNETVSTSTHAGGSFSWGWSVNNNDTVGFEVVYFFLGTRTNAQIAGSPWVNTNEFISRPYTWPQVNNGVFQLVPSGLPVHIPGELRGGIRAAISARATGWEINGVGNLIATNYLQLDALFGWRYFQFNEGLRIDQEMFQLDTNTGNPLGWARISEQIDAHNQFHGGQLGLRGEFRTSSFFVDFSGKVALGVNNQTVRTSGQTLFASPGFNYTQLAPGGLLIMPSNSGRFTSDPFTVLPEGTIRIGIRSGSHRRFYVGYNFMYLSDVVRPGDQLDLVVNSNQLPTARTGVPLVGPDRPLMQIRSSDLWVQGLMIGFETRY
jgi:hypothetical protein